MRICGKRIVMVLAMMILLVESIFAQSPTRIPRLNKKSLLNGLNVLVIENHETPKVTLSLMIKSGATFDPASKGGLADMTASMLKLGTTFRTGQQLASDISSMGASLTTAVDWDASYITTSGPAQDFNKLLDVLSDMILNPLFSEADFNGLKQARLAEIRRGQEDPAILADEAFNKLLFSDTAYGHPLRGTVESITGMTMADVKSFYNKFYIPNSAVLAVVGDVSTEPILRAVGRKLGAWVKSDPVPFTFLPPASPSGIKITIIDRPEATQAEVRVAHIGISRDNEDYFPVQLLSYVVKARLMSSSAEGSPARPSIGNRFDARRMRGPFVAYTSVTNDQAAGAVTAVIETLQSVKTGVTEKELDEAKKLLIDQQAAQLKTPENIAAQLLMVDLYQLGANYIDLYAARVQRVSLDDIKRAAERYVDPNNLVIVAVGKADELKSSLEKIGQVDVKRKT